MLHDGGSIAGVAEATSVAEVTKRCTMCGEEKAVRFFYKRGASASVLDSWCKSCKNTRNKAWRKANPEKVKTLNRLWNKANPEKRRAISKKWRNTNPEKQQAACSAWRNKNPDKIKTIKQAYRKRFSKKISQQSKLWAANNQAKVKESRKRTYKKINSDPLLKSKHRLRYLISKAFKRGGWKKSSRTHEILGCDYATALTHLENTFTINYGRERLPTDNVHIDHMIPISSVNTEKDTIRLNRYTNLQWLLAEDNLAKRDCLKWKSPYQKLIEKGGRWFL